MHIFPPPSSETLTFNPVWTLPFSVFVHSHMMTSNSVNHHIQLILLDATCYVVSRCMRSGLMSLIYCLPLSQQWFPNLITLWILEKSDTRSLTEHWNLIFFPTISHLWVIFSAFKTLDPTHHKAVTLLYHVSKVISVWMKKKLTPQSWKCNLQKQTEQHNT
jgi:hypothetical protein